MFLPNYLDLNYTPYPFLRCNTYNRVEESLELLSPHNLLANTFRELEILPMGSGDHVRKLWMRYWFKLDFDFKKPPEKKYDLFGCLDEHFWSWKDQPGESMKLHPLWSTFGFEVHTTVQHVKGKSCVSKVVEDRKNKGLLHNTHQLMRVGFWDEDRKMGGNMMFKNALKRIQNSREPWM
jgi:hypothetical protein